MSDAELGFAGLKLLLFWLFCAFLAMGFGARRGEGGVSLFLGLLFGPFGVLAAYFTKGTYQPCPFCRELRHPQATACPHCQRDLHEQNVAAALAAIETAPARKGISPAVGGVIVVFLVLLGVVLLVG